MTLEEALARNTNVFADSISGRVLAIEVQRLRADALRWQWLRQQQGWPDSEAAVSGYTPEQFDAMADAARQQQEKP